MAEEINDNSPTGSPEDLAEARRILEKNRKEVAIVEKLNTWFQSQTPKIAQRMKNYDVEEDDVSSRMDQTKAEMLSDLRQVTEPSKLEEIKQKAQQLLIDERGISSQHAAVFLKEILSLNPESLLDLISKALDGKLSAAETGALLFLNYGFEGRPKDGSHNYISDNIHLSILTPESLAEKEVTLHHEWTHYGLTVAVPEAKALLFLQDLASIADPNMRDSIIYAGGLIRAVDESAAFRAAAYFGGHVAPGYEAYKNNIPIPFFRHAFGVVDKVAESKNIEEFDKAMIKLFRTTVSTILGSNNNSETEANSINLGSVKNAGQKFTQLGESLSRN